MWLKTLDGSVINTDRVESFTFGYDHILACWSNGHANVMEYGEQSPEQAMDQLMRRICPNWNGTGGEEGPTICVPSVQIPGEVTGFPGTTTTSTVYLELERED